MILEVPVIHFEVLILCITLLEFDLREQKGDSVIEKGEDISKMT